MGWLSVGMACFDICIWNLGGRSKTNDLISMCLWIMIALLTVLNRFFIFWDLDQTGLHAYRFWIRKDVAWAEITHVSKHSYRPACLAIDWARPAPAWVFGRILAFPASHGQFLTLMRAFAPQAKFDL